MRIYVACLAAYTHGRLHGEWIDCEGLTAEEIGAEVSKMLSESPIPNAEEWAIHDSEGWFGWTPGEYESFERIAEVAEAMAEHDGANAEAVAAWIDHTGDVVQALATFSSAYQGEFESGAAYAEHYVTETWNGEGTRPEDHGWFSYVDWAAYWRGEFECGGMFIMDGHVFDANA